LESPARGCSGSKCFYAPGFAVQGRCARAPSPASTSPFPFDIFYWLHTSFFLTSFSLYICYLASYQLSTIAPSTGSATLNCFLFFSMSLEPGQIAHLTQMFTCNSIRCTHTPRGKRTHMKAHAGTLMFLCANGISSLGFRVQGLGKQKQVSGSRVHLSGCERHFHALLNDTEGLFRSIFRAFQDDFVVNLQSREEHQLSPPHNIHYLWSVRARANL